MTFEEIHGLPVKIHYNDDYNARRGEIYCADNSRDTFAMHPIIYKKRRNNKRALSLPFITVESERNTVNCVGGLIIALYRNYND